MLGYKESETNLIDEMYRAKNEAARLHCENVQLKQELSELKERLRSIKKIDTYDPYGVKIYICPACGEEGIHDENCWLLDAIIGEGKE